MGKLLYEKIMDSIDRHPSDPAAYSDMLSYVHESCARKDGGEKGLKEIRRVMELNRRMRSKAALALHSAAERGHFDEAQLFSTTVYNSLCIGGRYLFEDYLLAIDYNKPLDKKFYAPRQHYLKPYVTAYQKIADGELDFLSVSMPKRSGKSQTGINFVTWMSGRRPDRSSLMEGTGQDLVKSFYSGILEYLDKDSEYSFYDIFPDVKTILTQADVMTINLNRRMRFPTIMCRSIDSRQVGLSEATNVLYLDDCVEGREEAKNRQRLDDKWEVISGDVLGRAIEGTPIVICGTRYSLYDPIGRLQEETRKQNKRMEVIEIPALDPKTDESNFEHTIDGRRRFTTQYFRDQREMLTAEQFESEFQQQPFEAKGLLFPSSQLNRFFSLPRDKDPDTVFAVCDTADKGSDYCSMPILAVYGDEVYVTAVVFDDAPPAVTKPECAKALMDNRVVSAVFESNNAGEYFARDVNKLLEDKKYTCSITTKRTISNKQTRIEFASDNIIKNFYFLDASLYRRGSQYDQFMRQLTTYTRSGKVPHDDAPDSLAMADERLRTLRFSQIEVFDRPW